MLPRSSPRKLCKMKLFKTDELGHVYRPRMCPESTTVCVVRIAPQSSSCSREGFAHKPCNRDIETRGSFASAISLSDASVPIISWMICMALGSQAVITSGSKTRFRERGSSVSRGPFVESTTTTNHGDGGDSRCGR